MSKAIKKTLLSHALGLSAMMGVEPCYTDTPFIEHKPFVSRGMPKPRAKTEEEIKKKKEHRAKIKASRNAKKGIYEHKILYKRKENNDE